MKKPDSLRKALMEAIPTLQERPDQLLVFIEEGNIEATNGSSLSFEYHYTLSVVLTDYAGSADLVMMTMLAWMKRHQPDLLMQQKPGLHFEADHLNHTTCDLLLTLPLTESVIVTQQADGSQKIEHADEPLPDWGSA